MDTVDEHPAGDHDRGILPARDGGADGLANVLDDGSAERDPVEIGRATS